MYSYNVAYSLLFIILAIPTLGKCEWSGTVASLNSSLMTPKKCSEIGGNCCNWFGASWDGGVSGKLTF